MIEPEMISDVKGFLASVDNRLTRIYSELLDKHTALLARVDAQERKLIILQGKAPNTYQGVPVPETLKPNWDSMEAYHWRTGVMNAKHAWKKRDQVW